MGLSKIFHRKQLPAVNRADESSVARLKSKTSGNRLKRSIELQGTAELGDISPYVHHFERVLLHYS